MGLMSVFVSVCVSSSNQHVKRCTFFSFNYSVWEGFTHWVPGVLFTELKRPGRDDHLPPCSFEVMSGAIPLTYFHGAESV